MNITKAVITAAGRGARQYPAADTVQKAMIPLVDRDGVTKPVLQIIAEEAMDSGVEEICVVSAPGDEAIYRRQFQSYVEMLRKGFPQEQWANDQATRISELQDRLKFAVQDEPLGYGHSVWCARQRIGNEPFLLLLGDHLYISAETRRCARQVIDAAKTKLSSISAVQPTREHLIHQYGTVAGKRLSDQPELYEVNEIIEKPDPTTAELRLTVPGLRSGHYLCFFGIHALSPTVFDILGEQISANCAENSQFTLTTALNKLIGREPYFALETRGIRHNLGVKYGVVEAQIALALAGEGREKMLALLANTFTRLEQNQAIERG
ncbi:MAG: sugar phosphate nucleotidyltransferase [bacterium]